MHIRGRKKNFERVKSKMDQDNGKTIFAMPVINF